MCCCGKPTINGEPGAYSWDGKSFMTRPVDPPELASGDELIFDEPGRCGNKIDSHCFHFRIVRTGKCSTDLLVQHGGGMERIHLREGGLLRAIEQAGDDRYWLIQSFYHLQNKLVREATEAESRKWRQAIAQKKVKTRRRKGMIYVEIES